MRRGKQQARTPDVSEYLSANQREVVAYIKDHPDYLPRQRAIRPLGRAVENALKVRADDQLADQYDPDQPAYSCIRPTEELAPFSFVPVRSREAGWHDPPRPHRIQVIRAWKNGKPVLKEYRVDSAAKLKELAESNEYRRSRLFEATGRWEKPGADHYRRYVECYSPADPEVRRTLREAAQRRMRETTFPYEYGDDQSNGGSAQGVTGNIDQEFVPVVGGCFVGETKIPLLDGTEKSLAELAEANLAEFWVYSISPEGRVVPGRAHHARKTGEMREVLEVELDSGEKVRCTPDHQWMLRDGSYCAARDLQSGTSLMPLYRRLAPKGLPGYRMVVAVRHAGCADVYDITVDEWSNFALSVGAFVHNSYWRQQYQYSHWEALAKAFEQKNHSELAKAAISITSDFTLGRQVSWKIRNEKVAAIWQEFWDRNKMDQRLRTLSDDLTWQGELVVHKHQFLKGFLAIRSIDPGNIYDIVGMPEDVVENPIFYHIAYPAPYLQGYTNFNGVNLNIPLSKYIIQQLPAAEVFHLRNNVSSSEKWGRSDFYASLGTLKRHRDWANAVTLRDMLQANFVWTITINGDDADVQAWISDTNNAQLPAFGGTWVQNGAIKLEPMHQDVASRQTMGEGSTGAFLTALFATAQQMPVSYFNLMGPGTARATAMVQSEPFAKKIDTRQTLLSSLLDHVYECVMKTAVEAGRLDASLLRGEDADPEWIWPIIYEEDRKGKLADLVTAKGMGTISHRRLSTTVAGEFQMQSYDYEEEMAEIKKEAKDPLLKLWPPATGGPMAVTAPPVPTAPVPSVGAQPPGAPAGEQPQGVHELVKGADARAGFRDEQATKESVKLNESDRAFLEQAIRDGAMGELKLPSGAIATIHDEPPTRNEAGG